MDIAGSGVGSRFADKRHLAWKTFNSTGAVDLAFAANNRGECQSSRDRVIATVQSGHYQRRGLMPFDGGMALFLWPGGLEAPWLPTPE